MTRVPRTEPPLLSDRPGFLYPKPSSIPDDGSIWGRSAVDSRQQIVLELLWQPLWHCRYIDALADPQPVHETRFFDELPLCAESGNMHNVGALAWPKRFYCYELEFLFSSEPDDAMVASFLVGDKHRSVLPLALYQRRIVKPWSYYTVFHDPVHLPPVQNFSVSLSRPQRELGNGIVTCALNGWLAREVQ